MNNKLNIAIIGASGAVGAGFVHLLSARQDTGTLHAFARRPFVSDKTNVFHHQIDIEQEDSIETAAAVASGEGPLDLVIVATGILHTADFQPEKSLRDLSAEKLARVFAVNTTGPALVAKHFLPLLHRERRCVFAALTARVGSISDNELGGWYAYRASKAALNMILKTASIEVARRNKHAIVVGLHPGTVQSELSRPFSKSVKPEKLFTGEYSVGQLLNVIDTLQPEHSGRIYAWDGNEIAP